MAFDENLPDGNISIAQGDDDIRENNSSLESAIDFEHTFSTGGSQTGRHKFSIDTKENIDLVTAPDSPGALALASDPRPTASLVYFDGAEWQYADVGTGNIGRFDEVGNWDVMQHGLWEQVVPAAGAIDIDYSKSAMKYASTGNALTINNPIGFVAGYASSVMLELTMTNADLVLTWGNSYVTSNGVPPLYSVENGAVNVFYMTRMQNGTTLVTGQPALGPIL